MTARQALGKLTLQSVHTGLGVLGSAAASGLQISEGERAFFGPPPGCYCVHVRQFPECSWSSFIP